MNPAPSAEGGTMNEMTRMFSQAMCMPFTTFATGMEMMSRGMESWGRGSTDWQSGGRCCEGERTSTSCHPERRDHREEDRCGEWDACGTCGRQQRDCSCRRERGCGDTVRLVEWSLVSVARHDDPDGGKRGEKGGESRDEKGPSAFPTPLDRGEWVVSDCVSDEELRNQLLVDWGRRNSGAKAKNVRVYLRVLSSWRRNDWDYEDEQIRALHEIRDAINTKS
jgi:hypothetical protein